MKVFSLANEEQIFAKLESPEGTLVYPAITDAVLAVGVSTIGQEPEALEDGQTRGRRSRLASIKGRTHPGSWSFRTYVKPSGSLGTAPEGDVLYNCAFGKKTVNAGASVVYTLDSSVNMPAFSLWVRKGHTVFAMEGVTVNQAEFNVMGNEIAQVNWSGQFMKWYWAGRAQLSASCAPSAGTFTVLPADAQRFTTKARIVFEGDDNSGNGYTITDVAYSTGVVTFSPVKATGTAAIGSWVTPWWPASQTEVGAPVHGKLGIVKLNNISTTVLSAVITLTNNIKYYEDEKNGQWYATVYEAVGFREVSGTIQLYFYRGATNYFYRADQLAINSLIVPAGDVSGRIMELECPRIEYRPPVLSGDAEVMVQLPFIAVSSSTGDDEFKATFK